LKSEGKPIPCGRKKGGRNLPADEREQFAHEKRFRQQARELRRQNRAERKVRRIREREDARRRIEEHARRKDRAAAAGLPYWTEEELEQL
jgi:hypothetical protein